MEVIERRMGRKEREEKAGEGTISRSRGPATAERRSDLIGCGSDSLNSSTTFQRARARGRARASTRQDTDASRGKGAFARLLSSLPHYSIMMACGVCRTPFALIAPAPSPLPASSRAHPPVSPPHTLSPSPPKPIPPLFLPFHVPLPRSPLSFLRFPRTERERERETSVEMHTRTFRSCSSAENVFVGPSIQARARVHIAVTMMCVILRRLANVDPRRCDEEGAQARGEEKKREK